jgi:ribonucleoside-diphosphate reductase alpha chain
MQNIESPLTEAAVAPVKTAPVVAADNSNALGNNYNVVRRNGKLTSFDKDKIAVAMTKAFLAVEGGQAAASSRVHETVEKLTNLVVDTLTRRQPDGGTFQIEDIQDQVELARRTENCALIRALPRRTLSRACAEQDRYPRTIRRGRAH